METLIGNAIVQANLCPPLDWSSLCSAWNWGFWASFVLGVAGAAVLFFTKPTPNA